MEKFEVGAMYWDTSAVDHEYAMVIKITRRTEKSVWYVHVRNGKEDGEPKRTKIFTNEKYEYIIPERYSMGPVWDAGRKMEPEAADERETMEAKQETEPAAAQEAANEPDADADNKAATMTAQEITARELYARAHELRNRAEGLNYEGKLDDGFVRSIEQLEVAAYRAAAHESAMRVAAKNPRVAAAMERLRAKQAATERRTNPLRPSTR